MKISCIPIIGLLLTATAIAQQPGMAVDGTPLEGAEEIPKYTVEVIVFAYNEDVFSGTETFEPELVIPSIDELDDEPADGLVDDDSDDQAGSGRTAADPETEGADEELRYIYPFAYVVLEEQELMLTEAWSQLDRLDAYEPLMHFGWTQPTIADDQTPTLALSRFGAVPRGLDGSLKLYRSRFLHLLVDVSLAATTTAADANVDTATHEEPVAVFGDERLQSAYDDGRSMLQYAPPRYSITETRIVKNGETRYYDHPKFGVIAKLTRVEDEPAEESDRP